MRYPMKIATWVHPLFRLFGFRRDRCHVDLDDTSLALQFGSIQHTILLADISAASQRHWPIYYGLGNKLGPDHGVAYVGSFDDVVHIQLARPHDLQVWGPIRRSDARAVTFSVERSDDFLEALRARID
jgi:hypothetical protein